MAGYDIDTVLTANVTKNLYDHQANLDAQLKQMEQELTDLATTFLGDTATAYRTSHEMWSQGQQTMDNALHELASLLSRNTNHYIASDEDGASMLRAI